MISAEKGGRRRWGNSDGVGLVPLPTTVLHILMRRKDILVGSFDSEPSRKPSTFFSSTSWVEVALDRRPATNPIVQKCWLETQKRPGTTDPSVGESSMPNRAVISFGIGRGFHSRPGPGWSTLLVPALYSKSSFVDDVGFS